MKWSLLLCFWAMSLLCFAQPLADPDPVYLVGNGVSRPRPILSPEPDLSKEPKRDKYKGDHNLVAQVTIRPDSSIHGPKVYARIREAEVLRSIGDADLDAKVIEGMRTWIFEPCLKDQKPVSCKMNVEVAVHIQ
jgi:hypothetical protein